MNNQTESTGTNPTASASAINSAEQSSPIHITFGGPAGSAEGYSQSATEDPIESPAVPVADWQAVEIPPPLSNPSLHEVVAAGCVHIRNKSETESGTDASMASGPEELDSLASCFPPKAQKMATDAGDEPGLILYPLLGAVSSGDLGWHYLTTDDDELHTYGDLRILLGAEALYAPKSAIDQVFEPVTTIQRELVQRRKEEQLEEGAKIREMTAQISQLRKVVPAAKGESSDVRKRNFLAIEKLSLERAALQHKKNRTGEFITRDSNIKNLTREKSALLGGFSTWIPLDANSVAESLGSGSGPSADLRYLLGNTSGGLGTYEVAAQSTTVVLPLDNEHLLQLVSNKAFADSRLADRFLFCSFADQKISPPKLSASGRKLCREIINKIHKCRLTNAPRKVELTDDAKASLARFQKSYENRECSPKTPEGLKGYWNQAPTMLKKVALNLALIEEKDLIVTKEIVAKADWIVCDSAKHLAKIVAKGAELIAESSEVAKVRRTIEAAGGRIFRGDLTKHGLVEEKMKRLVRKLPSVFAWVSEKQQSKIEGVKARGGPKKYLTRVGSSDLTENGMTAERDVSIAVADDEALRTAPHALEPEHPSAQEPAPAPTAELEKATATPPPAASPDGVPQTLPTPTAPPVLAEACVPSAELAPVPVVPPAAVPAPAAAQPTSSAPVPVDHPVAAPAEQHVAPIAPDPAASQVPASAGDPAGQVAVLAQAPDVAIANPVTPPVVDVPVAAPPGMADPGTEGGAIDQSGSKG